MFVKKLVEKASKKYGGGGGGGSLHGLKEEDLNPRVTFHNGIPAGSSSLAYHPIQKILAISTRDGRIKLYGKDNTQALLQSDEAVPSKFLQFLENQGILFNVTTLNHIEVWDIDKKQLSYVHMFKEEITSFVVLQQGFFMYVGDCLGNICVFKLDYELRHLIHMQYNIPFSESHGSTTGVADDSAVIYTLPQPMAESKRVLIIFRDGLISLWGILESKVIFVTGGNTQPSSHQEIKKAVSACWACPFGSKVVVGYSTGEIFLWTVPVILDQRIFPAMEKKEFCATPNIPLLKLNLGYKMDKIPISSLRWVVGNGRASRLYVNGFSDLGSLNSFQVIILNENSESRTIKLVLPLPEACLAMEIISSYYERNKPQNALVLLLKSGQLCLYDDTEIEHYLLQCQSKSLPPLPNQVMVKLPFSDSSITIAKFFTGNYEPSGSLDEDPILLANKFPYLISIDSKEKDGNHLSSSRFSGFTKTRNLYITGHNDGAINIWDASCPLFLPILSIKHQSEDSNSVNGVPVTALYFDISSQILVAGDRNGLARIFIFKNEQFSSDNIFSFLQAKQGGNYNIRSVKLNGVIQTINLNHDSKHLVIGTNKGNVSVVDMEGTTILYQKQFPSELYSGIISLQFEKYGLNGYEKNVLLVGMQDSSVLALEVDTGNALSTNIVHPKKPSRALLMQILDGPDVSPKGACTSDWQDISQENSVKDSTTKQSLLLVCSEKSLRVYYLNHVIQGIKKLYSKKKLHDTCCWASIVHGAFSVVGLILIFAGGKTEIRSLPNLTLIKETSFRGVMFSTMKAHPSSYRALCASSEGEIVLVNGDQEIVLFSVLFRKDIYRYLEYISQVYKDVAATQEGIPSMMNTHKEKKKGVFSTVVKDIIGNKTKHNQGMDTVDSGASTAEELSVIFSTANFSLEPDSIYSSVKNGEDELNIDDIDLEDTREKPKGRSYAVLNKQKLGKKLQAIRVKLKPKTVEKANSGIAAHEDEKVTGAIDQIKKKYGYTMSSESSIPKMAESKLSENVTKLEGIGVRTTEMQNTAQSFSSTAKELLRTAQKERRIS